MLLELALPKPGSVLRYDRISNSYMHYGHQVGDWIENRSNPNRFKFKEDIDHHVVVGVSRCPTRASLENPTDERKIFLHVIGRGGVETIDISYKGSTSYHLLFDLFFIRRPIVMGCIMAVSASIYYAGKVINFVGCKIFGKKLVKNFDD